MKLSLTFVILLTFISCSSAKKESAPTLSSENPHSAEDQKIPDYTGKWVAKVKGGTVWTLNIFESAFKTPQPYSAIEREDYFYAQVVALLHVKLKPLKEKNIDYSDEIIYSLNGTRVLGNRVLVGDATYENSHPFHTYLLKFKIPTDLGKGFVAHFEHSRTGLMYESPHPEIKNEIFELHFKREL